MSDAADDPTILDLDALWRRIHPIQVVDDGNGGLRPSTAAFSNSSDGTGMSVTLGREAEDEGLTPDEVLIRHTGFSLAAVTTSVCRVNEQTLQREPTNEDHHHALVNGKKTRGVRNALRHAATWVVPPGNVES